MNHPEVPFALLLVGDAVGFMKTMEIRGAYDTGSRSLTGEIARPLF